MRFIIKIERFNFSRVRILEHVSDSKLLTVYWHSDLSFYYIWIYMSIFDRGPFRFIELMMY